MVFDSWLPLIGCCCFSDAAVLLMSLFLIWGVQLGEGECKSFPFGDCSWEYTKDEVRDALSVDSAAGGESHSAFSKSEKGCFTVMDLKDDFSCSMVGSYRC